MIYYFSGTHNSRYAALRLGSLTDQEVRFIPDTNPYQQKIEDFKDNSIGFVFPVYAWGVPPIVIDFIRKLPEDLTNYMMYNYTYAWCVATCGDETGMAVRMLEKELKERGIPLEGSWSLIMPNIYVLLPGFGTDPKEVENAKLKASVGRLEEIADIIRKRQYTEDVHIGPMAKLKTALIYPLFKRWGVNTKKWHYTDACISCGRCAKACPVENITIKAGHPEWGTNCTSCCACYHVCPTNSTQYGNITKGMGQYYNKE